MSIAGPASDVVGNADRHARVVMVAAARLSRRDRQLTCPVRRRDRVGRSTVTRGVLTRRALTTDELDRDGPVGGVGAPGGTVRASRSASYCGGRP